LDCARPAFHLFTYGALCAQVDNQVRSSEDTSSIEQLNICTGFFWDFRHKPLQLRAPLFCHSLAMVFLNGYICLELYAATRDLDYNFGCQPCRVSFDPHEMRVSWSTLFRNTNVILMQILNNIVTSYLYSLQRHFGGFTFRKSWNSPTRLSSSCAKSGPS